MIQIIIILWLCNFTCKFLQSTRSLPTNLSHIFYPKRYGGAALTKPDTGNQWQNWLNIKILWFLLQTLLHITNIINCKNNYQQQPTLSAPINIYVLLLPSLSHKVTPFQLYKPKMNNLLSDFNLVRYFLFLGGRWQILVFDVKNFPVPVLTLLLLF